MISAQLAFTYAKAFRESARSRSILAEAGKDMKILEKILATMPQVGEFCLARHEEPGIGQKFIQAAFAPLLGSQGMALISLLLDNNRLALVPFLPKAWKHLEDMENRIVEVVLECASQPEPELLESMRTRMEARTGSPVQISHKTDPGLLGGYRILWQNHLLDLSTRGRIEALRQHLNSV